MKDLGIEWSGHDINSETEKQALQYRVLVIPLINVVKELKASKRSVLALPAMRWKNALHL